ncbi:MAG: histidine kinase [Bacteroidota bacterium]
MDTLFYTFLLTVLLFEGNGRLNDVISKYVTWVEQPAKRALLGIAASVIYSTLITVSMYWVVFVVSTDLEWQDVSRGVYSTIIISLIVTSIISLTLHARQFLLFWRDAAIRLEKLKQEQLDSRFASLKAQLNPHFLFNSLNVLTSLVYKDADQSAAFIKKLSQMYRYILEYSDEQVVTLAEELECLEAYLFLQDIRHGDNLIVSQEVIARQDMFVPPLALQMLMENASKHNIISQAKPLTVRIYLEDNRFVVVENNLQRKDLLVTSTGKGLQNIKARYQLLSQEEVVVEDGPDIFRVKIPVLFVTKGKIPMVANNLRIEKEN